MSNLSFDPTALPRIDVIGQEYEIPVLGKHRRIAVMLPHGYDEHPNRRYPVLYLQDGQNLYEEYSPFGTWAVDKRMAQLYMQGFGEVIVVAIDHAEEYRIKEFSPFQHPKLGHGEGDQYIDFIVQDLKPHIDEHYRTLPTREHTGIGGSSMGGLISIYAGLMRPDVYSKMMIFSPSLWVSSQIFEHAKNYQPLHNTRVYLYAGTSESDYLVANLTQMRTELEKVGRQQPGKLSVNMHIRPNATHSEFYWGEAFPDALRWLYYGDDDDMAS